MTHKGMRRAWNGATPEPELAAAVAYFMNRVTGEPTRVREVPQDDWRRKLWYIERQTGRGWVRA